jgi:acetoin utilization deacetylase AcuC-like enzyme
MEQLTAVHPADYVDEVRAMSERGGGSFDPDTVASPDSYEAALHAAGGACAMVEALVGGEPGVGFSGMRPPGHHALPRVAMGFCLFANVAIAARHALDSLGLQRVFVFDWDVHHGNGTNDIFWSDPRVLFASIHQSPLYPGTGSLRDVGGEGGEGYTINLPVPPGSGDGEWLSLVEHVVLEAARAFEPQLVLVSAGFDAHRADPLAMCELEASSFGFMARQVRGLADELGVPVGAVLEGGYDLGALAASVAATLEGLRDGGAYEPPPRHPISARAAEVVGRYWSLPAAGPAR